MRCPLGGSWARDRVQSPTGGCIHISIACFAPPPVQSTLACWHSSRRRCRHWLPFKAGSRKVRIVVYCLKEGTIRGVAGQLNEAEPAGWSGTRSLVSCLRPWSWRTDHVTPPVCMFFLLEHYSSRLEIGSHAESGGLHLRFRWSAGSCPGEIEPSEHSALLVRRPCSQTPSQT
jgi:hypothetical protein